MCRDTTKDQGEVPGNQSTERGARTVPVLHQGGPCRNSFTLKVSTLLSLCLQCPWTPQAGQEMHVIPDWYNQILEMVPSNRNKQERGSGANEEG